MTDYLSKRTHSLAKYFGIDEMTNQQPFPAYFQPSVSPDFHEKHRDLSGWNSALIGTIVHVTYGSGSCRACLVTGLGDDYLYVTIFSPNLKPQEAVVYSWHYTDECEL